MFERRVLILFTAGALALGAVTARLVWLQLLHVEAWEREGKKVRTRRDPLPFLRGRILDRKGELLAADEVAYDLVLVPEQREPGSLVDAVARAATGARLRSLPDPDARFLALTGAELEAAAASGPRARQLLEACASRVVGLPGGANLIQRSGPPLGANLRVETLRLGAGADARVAADRDQVLRAALAVPTREVLDRPELRLAEAEPGLARARKGRPAPSTEERLAALRVEAAALAALARALGEDPGTLADRIDGAMREAEARAELALRGLTGTLGLGREERQRARVVRRNARSRPQLLARGIGHAAVAELALAETGGRLPGLQVRSRTERRAQRDALRFAPHVIGWLGVPPESGLADDTDAGDLEEEIRELLDELEPDAGMLEEIDRLRAAWRRVYRPGEPRGLAGAERAFEERLRGSWGWEQVERDRGGRELELLDRQDPAPGQDVTLTIDAALQQHAEELLDGSPSGRGALVALDPWTGDVLALATAPRFALSELRSRYQELEQDPARPLFNRAIQNHIVPPPGSVFKVVTAIAGLEEGVLDPDEHVPCQGYLNRPGRFQCKNHAPGLSYELRGALAKSCNVYFYRLGERLGQERLTRWARTFGFGERAGIGLVGEEPGAVEVKGEEWDANQGRLAGIGQFPVQSTPLQVAAMMAAVATEGRRPRPRLLHRAGGESREPEPPVAIQAGAETWRRVREGLRAVVEEGSAARLGLKRLKVAGKTGTPQTTGRPGALDHAWFAGYAPADRPVVAFAVFVESTVGHGGEAAAPVAEAFLTRFFESRRE